jgi:hypothetical protein
MEDGKGVRTIDRTKWNITKAKGRWWLIRPLTHPRPWIAEHVGSYESCVAAWHSLSLTTTTTPTSGTEPT